MAVLAARTEAALMLILVATGAAAGEADEARVAATILAGVTLGAVEPRVVPLELPARLHVIERLRVPARERVIATAVVHVAAAAWLARELAAVQTGLLL